MPREEKTSGKTLPPPTKSTVVFLLGTMADTTWRMFVPIIGMTLLGLWLDKVFYTTPWIMITSMVIGIVLAVLLVRQQMKRKVDV